MQACPRHGRGLGEALSTLGAGPSPGIRCGALLMLISRGVARSSRHGGEAARRDERGIGQALHISASKGVVTYFLGMDSYLLKVQYLSVDAYC